MIMLSPLNHCSKIKFIVKFSARQFNIEVDITETVLSLKENIYIIYGIPIKRMFIFYYGIGIELEEDFCNLSEYGMCEFSKIMVFLKTMNDESSKG
jgi:hypothetical protein